LDYGKALAGICPIDAADSIGVNRLISAKEANSPQLLAEVLTSLIYKAFKLGQFNELYKNSPRDSELVNAKLTELFGSSDHDGTVKGYAALECAIADILYSQTTIIIFCHLSWLTQYLL
jgi:hypothetical protein